MTDEYEPCPEYGCGIPFAGSEEVVSHLMWDHNYSEYKAKDKVEQ